MKKTVLIILFSAFSVAGCGRPAPKEHVLARVNNYEITREEFEREFIRSPYAKNDTPQSREKFLERLVNVKLILQDAQAQGLDKDPDFLRMVERFWEQSLLKLTVDKKAKEIARAVSVSDRAVEEIYQKLSKEGKIDKPYDKVYPQIKWEVRRLEEARLMEKWFADLNRNADITINKELLEKGR